MWHDAGLSEWFSKQCCALASQHPYPLPAWPGLSRPGLLKKPFPAFTLAAQPT